MLSSEQILDLIRERVHHPASVRELMQRLDVPREQRVSFRRQLKKLAAEGELVQVRGHRYGVAESMDLVVGRLETNVAGYGFVVPDRTTDGVQPDVYVSAANLTEAMHGDRVVARVERVGPDGRREGRVIRILERANTTIVGRFELDEAGGAYVVPFDRRLTADLYVIGGQTLGARPGQMVTAEIVRWPSAARGPAGRVVEVLGDIDTPGVDTLVVIRKHGIPDAHSPQAVEEARRLVRGRAAQAGSAGKGDTAGRTDFRGVRTVTIDGEHARDFDDAVSVELLPNGHWLLGVHISDVSHYVREDGALDADAYERGTSVYFPERALHMFPAQLATDLCSLNPRVDRLVQSVLMEIDRRGNVVRYEFHDGIIRTAERMSYAEVNAVLTGGDPEATQRYLYLVPMFESMRDLFQVLNDRRRRLGSIDFDLEETEVVLDQAGMIEAIIPSERNVAHRIIEEFMLLANETVAQFLEEQEVPSLYRIHEEPDPLKVEKFEQFLASLGYSLKASPDGIRPRHFQRLIEQLRGKPEEKPVAYLMLRTMQKAKYDQRNLGHFGLAFESYTHFTSPIRRYPDLVVHRMLRAARKGTLSPARLGQIEEGLPDVARHTSDMERRADEAERELLQWKKVRFMADKVGDEFDGYITGVAPFGLFIELVEHFVEGMVHVSTMADDYYHYDGASHTLKGGGSGRTWRLGDRVRVQVLRVDRERRQIELGLVAVLEAVRREEAAVMHLPRRGARRKSRFVRGKSGGTGARAGAATKPRTGKPGRSARQAGDREGGAGSRARGARGARRGRRGSGGRTRR
jgi:ribonuclease R